MANNRLYLVDVENGEKFLLAKGWADGWQVWDCAQGKSLAEQLHEWLKHRDIEAAVGNPKSYLTIMTENDSQLDLHTNHAKRKHCTRCGKVLISGGFIVDGEDYCSTECIDLLKPQ
jgi:hypothetical protein